MAPIPSPPLILVLDTNVVLDWLLFADAAVAPLARLITTRQARWVATDAMHQELEHVLTRSRSEVWQVASTGILTNWGRWVEPAVAQPPSLAQPLRCSDPDDQKFIDLALQVGAAALLSRDRAVLKLTRRAKAAGLDIVTPTAWAQQGGIKTGPR
jgi:predicted nucleic acid-binding protein